jgi:hypothetical protein
MGSSLFINHSLGFLNLAYKVLGLKATNFIINNSVASIFTSGETVESLVKDVSSLKEKNIECIGGYFVEGLKTQNETKIQQFYQDLVDSITALTEGGQEGHVALRFTTMISLDVL